MDNKTDQIAGYSYGAKEVANSPVSLEELEQLKQTATQKHEDVRYLRMAGDVLNGQERHFVESRLCRRK
jgi:hypothetical protein